MYKTAVLSLVGLASVFLPPKPAASGESDWVRCGPYTVNIRNLEAFEYRDVPRIIHPVFVGGDHPETPLNRKFSELNIDWSPLLNRVKDDPSFVKIYFGYINLEKISLMDASNSNSGWIYFIDGGSLPVSGSDYELLVNRAIGDK